MPAPGDVAGRRAGLSGRRVAEDGALCCHLGAQHGPVLGAQQHILLLRSWQRAASALRGGMILLLRCFMAVCAAEGVPRLSLRKHAPACSRQSLTQQQL